MCCPFPVTVLVSFNHAAPAGHHHLENLAATAPFPCAGLVCCWQDQAGSSLTLQAKRAKQGAQGRSLHSWSGEGGHGHPAATIQNLPLTKFQAWEASIPGLPLNFLSKACPSRLAGRAARSEADRQAVGAKIPVPNTLSVTGTFPHGSYFVKNTKIFSEL